MSYLTDVLDHIGFDARPQQIALFDALLDTDETGTVAQAGTGTGKSLAVLAAGAYWKAKTGLPSLVVVPMNNLLLQYIEVDAPRVEEALGITIRSLMGRNRYLCAAAPGFAGVARAEEWVIAREVELSPMLDTIDIDTNQDIIVTLTPTDAAWFGCPGRDEGCNGEQPCHYRLAKAQLETADIIVTNAHLLILDDQLRMKPPIVKENEETGETLEWQPSIFPQFGALFVDECHTFEDVLRSFATRSIPYAAAESLDVQLAPLLALTNEMNKNAVEVRPSAELVSRLKELADIRPEPGQKLKKHQQQAVDAAAFILLRGAAGAYTENEAVLWFQPDHPYGRGKRGNPKLTSTQINLAGGANRLLTRVPFGMVSGTVPKSLRGALGISDAVFIDCGHPFDYSKQGKLAISKHSGSFKATQNVANNRELRADEVLAKIRETQGGALVLFSSYKDMEDVYMQLLPALRADNLVARRQERDGDNGELGKWFKDHGNAVLFGTSTFATGFDVPGDALRLVCIWKLPYPGLDPVTKAIQARSRQRYEDMMRMAVTQAVGRLIRTTEDTGTVFIADSRAENLVGDDDPMLAHLAEFTRADKPRRVRAWDVE